MSGWEAWCKSALTNGKETLGSKAGIFCKTNGDVWHTSPATFQIPKDQVLFMAKVAEGKIPDENCCCEYDGKKWMFLRREESEGVHYALYKKDQCGITVAVAGKGVVIGMYEEGTQPGKNCNAVTQTAINLRNAGY